MDRIAKIPRKKGEPFDTEILALRAGDLAFLCLPGELFSQYAARFRELSPFPATAVISIANDSVGYLVTDETLEQGGAGSKPRLCRSARTAAHRTRPSGAGRTGRLIYGADR